MTYGWNDSDLEHFGDIRTGCEKLIERLDQLQADWENSPESWRDSEAGESVENWIEDMANRIREVLDSAEAIEGEEPDE